MLKFKLPTILLLQIGRYFNHELSISGPVGEFFNGSIVPLDSLPSTCTASCAASCTHQDTDYLFVESPDKLYIIASFNVHQPGSKPLECGLLRGDQVTVFCMKLNYVITEEDLNSAFFKEKKCIICYCCCSR